MKMNNVYLPDGFPNTPDIKEVGGNYTAGDGIAISAESAISVDVGDGLAINASKKVVPNLGDGLTLNASDKIVPDVDGTTIGINDTTKKLECLVSGGLPDISTTEVDMGFKWLDGKEVYAKAFTNAGVYWATPGWSSGYVVLPYGCTLVAAICYAGGVYYSNPAKLYDTGIEYSVNFYQGVDSNFTVDTVVVFYTKNAAP